MKIPFDSDNVSDELLNAFIDNELDKEEHLQMLQALLRYPSINLRVCELRQLKELVASARPQEQPVNTNKLRYCLGRINMRAIAASLLLLIAVGTLSISTYKSWQKPANSYTYTYQEINPALNMLATHNKTNIVFHINKNNVHLIDTLFTDIEKLLVDPRVHDKNIRIEVLTSGSGLYLLDTLSDKHKDQINHLYTQHENISFVICQKTLTKFRKQTKKLNQLPRGMVLTASAPELIKLRRKQGWTYISI